MKKLCLAIILLITLITTIPFQEIKAQYRIDALRYTFELPGQDAANMGMGGASVALGQDFGSFVLNPATAAMGSRPSYFSFGLGTRDIREEDSYINQTMEFSDTQTGITNFGMVFQAPTERGALSFGLGYSQTADFNRALNINDFNDLTTITDWFLEAGDDFFEPAFNAIAIDTFTENGEEFIGSSWRPPFSSQYVGVDQYAEMTERGQMGEYTLFASTEFIENFFVGLSLNLTAGSYSYRRTFIEEQPDIQNDYDVISIFTDEEINASIGGVHARIGGVYKFLPWFNVGVSYTTPSKLKISEDFSNLINTTFVPGTFGDGDVWEDEYSGAFDYTVSRPARFSIGAAVDDLGGLSATVSAERVDYSNINLGFDGERLLERNENMLIREEYEEVINLRTGLSYTMDVVTLRAGYALVPSARKDFSKADRQYYSGGVGFGLAEGLTLDFSLQMGRWEDENILYTFTNNDRLEGEFVDEQVTRFHGIIGLRFAF
ncbi:MAG: hypothetical protein WD267_13710 [Balneolales bacterium]